MVKKDYVLLKRGVRILENGEHVKTIPVVYLGVALREKFVKDKTSKRLTVFERFLLSEALFKLRINTENPNLYRLIKNKTVKKAIIERNQRDEIRYLFVYQNIRVIVPEWLFKLYPKSIYEEKAIW